MLAAKAFNFASEAPCKPKSLEFVSLNDSKLGW